MYISLAVEREIGFIAEYDPERESKEELLSDLRRLGVRWNILYEGPNLHDANQAIEGMPSQGKNERLEARLTEYFEGKRK